MPRNESRGPSSGSDGWPGKPAICQPCLALFAPLTFQRGQCCCARQDHAAGSLGGMDTDTDDATRTAKFKFHGPKSPISTLPNQRPLRCCCGAVRQLAAGMPALLAEPPGPHATRRRGNSPTPTPTPNLHPEPSRTSTRGRPGGRVTCDLPSCYKTNQRTRYEAYEKSSIKSKRQVQPFRFKVQGPTCDERRGVGGMCVNSR